MTIMDVVSDELLRSLADARGEPVITSLYLQVDGRVRPRAAAYRAAAENLLRVAGRAAAAISEDAAAVVADAAERITTWLADDLDRAELRGVAFFACSPRGPLRVVELPTPVQDHVTVDVVADLRQLTVVRSQGMPTLVVLTDHERAQLLLVTTGSMAVSDCLIDQWARHVDTEATIGSLEHKHAEADLHHLRRVAAAVDVEVGRLRPRQVVLGGPTEAVGELKSLLSTQAQAILIGTIGQWPTDPLAEILPAVNELRTAALERRQADLVRGLAGRLAEGRATVGLAGTFDAVAAGRVETLLLPDGFAAAGRRCPSCDRLWTPGEQCGACGAPTEAMPDVVPALVAKAIAQGADVEVIDEPQSLEDVAAIERFSLKVA